MRFNLGNNLPPVLSSQSNGFNMKIFFYVLFSLAASFGINAALRSEIKPQDNPETLNFQPAYNVTIGPKTLIAAYPVAGVDFTLNHVNCVVYIGSETGMEVFDADVFMLNGTTWTATQDGGEYVTVNAQTGETQMYRDGVYKCFTPEISKP